MNNYLEQIKEFKCVSFDIFDTLILRDVLKPTDIFDVVYQKLAKQGILVSKLSNFKVYRVEAELAARKKSHSEEVNLDDIYNQLSVLTDLNNLELDIVKNVEIQTEIEFCTANTEMLAVYHKCKKDKKKIFFTSDMYLPYEVISKILQNCGYEVDNNLLLSSQKLKSKHKGDLFNILIIESKCSKVDILHIGDNFYADFEQAINAGIKSIHYKSPRDTALTEYLPTSDFNLSESILFASVANSVYSSNKLSFWERFGKLYAMPIYFGFTLWLKEMVNKESDVFFLSRDGYILQKVYEVIKSAGGGGNTQNQNIFIPLENVFSCLHWCMKKKT